MKKLKRAWVKLALWFIAWPCLVVGFTACAMAPPPEATAITQVEAEQLVDDVARIAANKARSEAVFVKLWGDENAKRVKAAFDARINALVDLAAAESRPVAPGEIAALIELRDAVKAESAANIEKTRRATADPNLAIAAERAQLLLEYVSEITERERQAARIRKSLGLHLPAVPSSAPPPEPIPVPIEEPPK